MVDNERLKLGIFAIVAIVILFLSLFLIGLRQMFEPKLMMTTIFEESIQGIDVGTAIKFRGVPVGKVNAISIRPYGQGIRVDMQVNLAMFDPVVEIPTDESRKVVPFSKEYFRRQVQKGLRAQLEMSSVMGTKYIEIDYFDTDGKLSPIELKLMNSFDKDDFFYIPSKRSLLSDLKTSAAEIMLTAQKTLNNINQIDFIQLNETALEIRKTFIDVQKQLNEKGQKIDTLMTTVLKISNRVAEWTDVINIQELKETLQQVNEITDASKKLVDEVRSEFKAMKLSSTVEEAKNLMIQVQEEVKRANVGVQLERFNASVERISHDANTASISMIKLTEDAQRAVNALSPVLINLAELLNSLEENPSEVLYGPRNVNQLKRYEQLNSAPDSK